jgi:hypothetical protein
MSIGTIDRRASRRARKTELLLPEPVQVDPAAQLVLDAVSHAERQRLSFATELEGPEAEHIATTSLEILGRYGWSVLHEDHWPGQTEPQLAHVAVGPGGVVVVVEKAWIGHVVVDDGVLRHNGYRCEKDLDGLSVAVGTIESLLPPEHRSVVVGVIYVAPRDMAPQMTAGVHVVGRLHLASLLVGMPQQLSPIDVADITRILTRVLGRPVTPMVDSGAGAISTGTRFFPVTSQDTSAYFNPRAVPPELEPGSNFAPVVAVFPTPHVDRFGIRTDAGVPTPQLAPEYRRTSRWDDASRATPWR